MKIKLKQILTAYISSWWLPGAICLTLLAAFTFAALPRWHGWPILSGLLLACLAVAFLGLLGAAVWNFVEQNWAKGAVNLALFLVCGIVAFIAGGLLAFTSLMFASPMLGPTGDGFAAKLSIPDDIEVAEPLEELDAAPGGAEDGFQQALMAALDSPGGNDPTLTADVSALSSLHANAPEVLRRYLATSPAWRVFKEGGEVYATRRWMIGPHWHYDLHGYYTQHDLGYQSYEDRPRFQSRVTLGLSGEPWAGGARDTTRLRAGRTARVKLSSGNGMHESLCFISAGDLVVEIFEQSETKERRLTKAALAYVEAELAPLAAEPTWQTIRASLPPGSIRRGAPSFALRDAFQPGLYDSELWINPGEPGMIYLKAFEVTQGTPLTVHTLRERSNEWMGWSEDPEELFFSNTHFTIYEGDWGQPYAARFEVWFVPDAGGPERKLMEKVFKIEGWQR